MYFNYGMKRDSYLNGDTPRTLVKNSEGPNDGNGFHAIYIGLNIDGDYDGDKVYTFTHEEWKEVVIQGTTLSVIGNDGSLIGQFDTNFIAFWKLVKTFREVSYNRY